MINRAALVFVARQTLPATSLHAHCDAPTLPPGDALHHCARSAHHVPTVWHINQCIEPDRFSVLTSGLRNFASHVCAA